MNRKILFTVGGGSLLGLFAILIFGLFFASDPKSIPSPLVDQRAAPFVVETFSGERISLVELRGRPVILNFWASWCVACREEAYILEGAHRTFSKQGAVFIGIAINDTREKSMAFIQKYRKSYNLAPDDESGTIALDYGVTAVPETFFIDEEGIIRQKIVGAIQYEQIRKFLTSGKNIQEKRS